MVSPFRREFEEQVSADGSPEHVGFRMVVYERISIEQYWAKASTTNNIQLLNERRYLKIHNFYAAIVVIEKLHLQTIELDRCLAKDV